MTESKRDLRKPISYCCEKIKDELSRGDIIDYIWYSRDYILRSSRVPAISTYAEFCPWCGSDLGKFSLDSEYWHAFQRASEEDPTMRKQSDSELEGFHEEFLRGWELKNPIE
jgi:hypothetical protein